MDEENEGERKYMRKKEMRMRGKRYKDGRNERGKRYEEE